MTTSDRILLGHGGGGRLTRELIADEIVPRFGSGPLRGLPDSALLPRPGGPVVFTTDSFVVKPLEFPGGNIGGLAVHGTVNDLAVAGGSPRWLSVGLILEEGLERSVLRRVLDALRAAADDCGVTVATGDTKVVPRGLCDGLYVNTAGFGELLPGYTLDMARIAPGDRILLSGPLGDHGAAILAAREGIGMVKGPASDTGPVHRLTAGVAPEQRPAIRFMRDPTRGGAAAVLNECAGGRPIDLRLDEPRITVSPPTAAVCEMLGFDPLHLACEGRLIAFCAADHAPAILDSWRRLPEGAQAVEIGEVRAGRGRVILRTVTGGERLVDVPGGELLPRIC